MKASRQPATVGCDAHEGVHPRWRRRFVADLEQSACVVRSAERAGISTARAYCARRNEPEFAQAWLAALSRGCEDVEMEVLRRLRDGDLLAQDGVKYDFTSAIRLLGLHPEGKMQAQADRRNVTAAGIRASIDRKIADIRQRINEQDSQAGHAQ